MRYIDADGNEMAKPDESLWRMVPERILVEEGTPYVPAKKEKVLVWQNENDRYYESKTIAPEQPMKPPVYENVIRCTPYTSDELEQMEADRMAAEAAAAEAAAEAERQAALQKRIEALPDQVDEHDEAIVALYEGLLQVQEESDEAITAIYEAIVG